MKKLLIIGARGYGRGVYDIARSMPSYGHDFVIKGYLDDNKDVLAKFSNYPPIIGTVEDYIPHDDDVFVCALGSIAYKQHYVRIIKEKGGVFYTLIHPSSSIGNNVRIGEGCIIGYGTQIDCDVEIGDFVGIQTNVVVGHDAKIGSWSILDCYSFMGGGSQIGEAVTMHTHSVLIPQKKIGNNVVVNASSLVIRDVHDNKVVMGNPAKEIFTPKKK